MHVVAPAKHSCKHTVRHTCTVDGGAGQTQDGDGKHWSSQRKGLGRAGRRWEGTEQGGGRVHGPALERGWSMDHAIGLDLNPCPWAGQAQSSMLGFGPVISLVQIQEAP